MGLTVGGWSILVLAMLMLGCDGGGLGAQGSGGTPGRGGASGTNSAGGIVGTGGAQAGGGVVGSGGSGTAGSKSGGKVGSSTGGSITAGKGGANAGGTVTGGVSGTGGTMCVPPPCIACPYGFAPNFDPCSCPVCIWPDAGPKDAATVDATGLDGVVCLPGSCPAIDCGAGSLIVVDACGCETCVAPDAAPDTTTAACAGLDSCACLTTSGCAPIAESCFCPSECTPDRVCVCGGGRFIGCAPVLLATCGAAHDRVAALCPQITGALFEMLCQQSDSACVTKCLNEVTSCGDLSCSLCEGCDCASKSFATCAESCRMQLRG